MCGRYALSDGIQNEKMLSFIEICNQNALPTERIDESVLAEVRPGDLAPGLICTSGRVQAVPMRWGFVGKDGKLVINARGENVSERSMFKRLTDTNRCIMPAAAYFEWRRGDGQKYRVASAQQEAMYLAGLYRLNDGGRREFVILTRAAFGIHTMIHNRMPVTLQTRKDARAWLRSEISIEDILSVQDDMLQATAHGTEQLSMYFEDE